VWNSTFFSFIMSTIVFDIPVCFLLYCTVFGCLRRHLDRYFVLLQSQPHLTTITYNYLLCFCAFKQLQSLYANIPFYSLTAFITQFTSSHIHTFRFCLLSRSHCLELTLRTDSLDIPVSLIKPSIVQTSLLSERGVYRSVSQQGAR
jgi:hypothetical protein